MSTERDYLTIKEAAKAAGVSVQSIYQRLETSLSKRDEEFEELNTRYESVKKEIERFDKQINKPNNEGDEIRQKINEANQEKKMLYDEIMNNRQNMERNTTNL